MSNATTVLLCGVGGQGTILAADLLARTALASNYDVKVSEIHGMAQRGGAVTTVVRFGDKVQSMIADLGSADCVVSFETTEALRNLPYVKPVLAQNVCTYDVMNASAIVMVEGAENVLNTMLA